MAAAFIRLPSLLVVYIQATEGQGLVDVLVAGYAVDSTAAHLLKDATGGSDFVFTADDRVMATTLDPTLTGQLLAFKPSGDGLQTARIGDVQNVVLVDRLKNLQGRPIGDLRVVRSFEGVQARIRQLRTDVMQIWLARPGSSALALTWLAGAKYPGTGGTARSCGG